MEPNRAFVQLLSGPGQVECSVTLISTLGGSLSHGRITDYYRFPHWKCRESLPSHTLLLFLFRCCVQCSCLTQMPQKCVFQGTNQNNVFLLIYNTHMQNIFYFFLNMLICFTHVCVYCRHTHTHTFAVLCSVSKTFSGRTFESMKGRTFLVPVCVRVGGVVL